MLGIRKMRGKMYGEFIIEESLKIKTKVIGGWFVHCLAGKTAWLLVLEVGLYKDQSVVVRGDFLDVL